MTFEIEVRGIEALRRKLGQNYKPVLQSITRAVGEELKKVMKVAPPRNPGPVVWASEAQRIWYFASRAKDGLPMRYTRNSDPWSQRLEASWDVKPVGATDSVLKNGATYAAYVQAEGRHGGIRQQPMHHYTGWITDEQAIAQVKASGVVQHIVKQAMTRALGR